MPHDLSGDIERLYFRGYAYAALGITIIAGVLVIGYRFLRKFS